MQKFFINPWFSVWFKPRQTIRNIIEVNPKKGFYVLATISFFSDYLLNASRFFTSFNMQFWLTSIFVFILSPFLGALLFYIYGWVLKITGNWLKGEAKAIDLRSVIAWSHCPRIIVLILFCILFLFTPSNYFAFGTAGPIFLLFQFIFLVVTVWQLVIFVTGISEVQKFSIGKAIGNYFLLLLVYFVFFVFVGFLVGIIRAIFA